MKLNEVTNLKKRIVFANHNQVILYNDEISGQISDGHWENSRPHDHWRDMTSAEVSFSANPDEQGVFGFYPKRKYNFASSELLEIIGDRMIENVAKKGDRGYNRAKLVKDLKQMSSIVNSAR